MTAAGSPQVDPTLAPALPRVEDLPPLPPLDPLRRLYATPAVHRAVPRVVALALVRRKAGLAWWRSGEVREAARAAMESLVGATDRAGEVDALARAHVSENAVRSELEWRPSLGARFRIENAEALRHCHDGGLVHFMHHGPYVHLTGALKAAGITCYAPIAGYFFTAPEPGLIGHKDRSHLLSLMAGSPVFPAEGSGTIIPRLLGEGKLVGLASDLPGRLPARFLGRDVGVASGTAKLALATGRPVACLTFRRDGGALPAVVVEELLHPVDFSSPAELQAAILAKHEAAVLAWPEALERPLERWHRLDGPPEEP